MNVIWQERGIDKVSHFGILKQKDGRGIEKGQARIRDAKVVFVIFRRHKALQSSIDIVERRIMGIFVSAFVAPGQDGIDDNVRPGMGLLNDVHNFENAGDNGFGIDTILPILRSDQQPPDFGIKAVGHFPIFQSVQQIGTPIAPNSVRHAINLTPAVTGKQFFKNFVVPVQRGFGNAHVLAFPVFDNGIANQDDVQGAILREIIIAGRRSAVIVGNHALNVMNVELKGAVPFRLDDRVVIPTLRGNGRVQPLTVGDL